MKAQPHTQNLHFAIVSTDVVLLRNNDGVIEYATQLVRRPPHYDNIPGLIGGVIHPHEVSLEASERILEEKALIKQLPRFIPLGFYDAVDRDLRGRVVSLVYIGVLSNLEDGVGIDWLPLHSTKKLAYDHNKVLTDARAFLKEHLFISTIMLDFVGGEFVIKDLKKLAEYIKGGEIDKRNFYKFLDKLPIQMTKRMQSIGRGRPAQVYKRLQNKSFFLSI